MRGMWKVEDKFYEYKWNNVHRLWQNNMHSTCLMLHKISLR